MRAVALAMILATGCGARSGLEVDAPADAGRPDAFAFDTFTCRWSYGREAWFLAFVDVDQEIVRAALHPDHRSGVVVLSDLHLGFDVAPPPLASVHGAVGNDVAMVAWPARQGFHLFGLHAGDCHASEWTFDLLAERDQRSLFAGASCSYDPIGAEVAVALWGERLQVSAIGDDGLGGRRVAELPIASDDPPRITRASDGTIWITTHDGGGSAIHAIREGVEIGSRALGPATATPPLAPDRLRGGAVAGISSAGTLRLVRASLVAGAIELLELGALAADPDGPRDLVTTEAEILFPRADGSYASVPLSGAAPRTIPAPEPGAEPGVLAMVDGTSAGAVVYRLFDVLRIRPLTCNR